MRNTIRTTIDKAGRIVIPKGIRQLAAIQPGMEVEISFEGGAVKIEPAPRDVHVEERGGLLVAVAASPGELLTSEAVRQTRDSLRDRRQT